MPGSTRDRRSFPAVKLPAREGASPTEVTLIAQLGIGAGDALITDASQRQRHHPAFIDALDEPSARLGGMHLQQGDPSSLYSFSVGAGGHPFHRHAGPRMFTAIAGSAGAELRFASASDAELASDPGVFARTLRRVRIPPDCLFTVRFGGGTWHQFASNHRNHPALFALSCHSNELAGAMSEHTRAQVQRNAGDIPSLTDVLPEACWPTAAALTATPLVQLSLQAAAPSLRARLCARTRAWFGPLRRITLQPLRGFVERATPAYPIQSQPPHNDGLLATALPLSHYQDLTTLLLDSTQVRQRSASTLLAEVLEGFLRNPPSGVGRLMALRNRLVAPLRLRTSPLGCPVSSLLSNDRSRLFVGRYPVLDSRVDADDHCAEVLLGADDRHLRFRSSVRVQLRADGGVEISLGSRVQTHNAFGRIYMALIDSTHRHYVAPALLRRAAEHALAPELDGIGDWAGHPAPR
ncbi:TPA: DUF2867 domain-containing protein [Stenotrophomonas maltophilia]|uniref:DUF2867 domain-containing protein n=1 Tax=Stenotrophomonas TaxID=40323 RepID=UPI00062D8877|nr:DUF2867 domain-containing protein [Stenotrophomonas maltophilia]TIE20186.1 DUF2867 domain-containing protein [Stenotrophomonas maltophilia]TIE61902.1 DUF2867 domain-containing protein [Stenotrophomonas maltophilia]